MTDSDQANIERIEKERRRREAALLILLLLLTEKARQLVGASIRMGVDPAMPIRQVILGDANLHFPGLPGMLAGAMADSHLAGYRRAFDMAGEPLVEVAPSDVLPLYVPGAFQVAAGVVDSLTAIVRQSMADGVAAQLRTAGLARAAMRSLTRYGWSRFDPQSVAAESTGSPGYAASTVSTNAVLTSYGNGMRAGYISPAIAARVTGFRHASVMDSRTSAICVDRDMLVLPKGNAYWVGPSKPPLHNHCRSILLATYGAQDWSNWLPTVPVDPPWGFGVLPAA